jgi:hypothetical protein
VKSFFLHEDQEKIFIIIGKYNLEISRKNRERIHMLYRENDHPYASLLMDSQIIFFKLFLLLTFLL